jgi:arsenate reductase (thioredoxin)
MTETTELAAADICGSPSSATAIDPEIATKLADLMKALADPLRLRMLSAIAADRRGESCVCDLAELAEVAQPTVSHHLKVLKDTGLLTSQRRGTWVWYRISPRHRGTVTALLDAFAVATTESAAANPSPLEALQTLEPRVSHLAEDLAHEFPKINPEVTQLVVRDSYASLGRTAKVTTHLIALTERFARQRLTDLTRDRSTGIPQVLFVCVANAGRSQLAAALTDKLGRRKVIARSAGSHPAAEVHPRVQNLLTRIEGVASARRFPKPITDDAVRAADVVITMGCGDACPMIPGIRYEDWAVGDPALASPQGVEAISADITRRVQILLNSLIPDAFPTER